MAGRRRFQVPDGWVTRGWRFEVEPTSPQQRSAIAQHLGARRFAYNWALAQIKANLDARAADPAIVPLAWDFYDLRRAWNQAKHQVAPWWRKCSKEAYASGIADLVTALHNWSAFKHGHRAGARVGFPRFKARRRDRGQVRFTTGAMRLEADRRHIILPVIGRLRCKENTRRLERLVAKGQARVLSMTLSQQGGRLFVSVATIVAQAPRMPSQPDGRCGIDLGIGAEWAVIAHGDDTIERIVHPAPWAAVQQERRRVARQRSRRMVGSRGHRHANARLAALDRRATNLRTNQPHTLLPGWHAATAPSWLRTSTSPRWAAGWAAARSAAASTRPGSAGSVRHWPTNVAGAAGSFRWRTGGSRPPRSTTAAAVIWPTSSSVSGCGVAPPVDGWWTATPTRPGISVTGPERSPTGMSSGVELPPRCRWWVTTAGRPTPQAWACEAM
jgi:transposase